MNSGKDVSLAVEQGNRVGARITTGISLVLPMYNERTGVDITMRSALDQLERNFEVFEIVVADDGSTDGCGDQVAAWSKREPRIRLVRLARNQRFGGALRAGLAAAQNDYIFYTDFDLQIGLDCLPQMFGELDSADVLTGYSAQQVKHANWRSTLISWVYNSLVRLLFGFRLRDINFGFKAMRKSVYEKMNLRSCSPFVDAEMFAQALANGHTIKQVAVPFSMRQVGVSNIRRFDVIVWTFWDMFRVRWAMWFKRR